MRTDNWLDNDVRFHRLGYLFSMASSSAANTSPSLLYAHRAHQQHAQRT